MDYLKVAQGKFAREATEKFPDYLRKRIDELKKQKAGALRSDTEEVGNREGSSDYYIQWLHLGGRLDEAEELLSVFLRLAGIPAAERAAEEK